MDTASKKIRILGFPAFSNRNSNSYNADFYESVMQHGIDVDEFSFKRALLGKQDIIHVHWPEKFLNSNYRLKALLFSAILLVCLKIHQIKGGKVVWTVHNLKPHEIKYPKCYRIFWSLFLRIVDATFSLSASNQKILFETYKLPNAKHHKIIHLPLYKKPDIQDTDKIFNELGISHIKPYCLFFGRILPYKNVEVLIDIFKNSPPKDLNLVIAGSCEISAYKEKLESLIDNSPNIKFIGKRISDSELLVLIQGCDIGIMPFKAIFNSGSLLQFPSYGKPAMTPYSDNFAEYGSLFTTSPYFLYKDKLTKELIENTIKKLPVVDTTIPKELTPEKIGSQAADFFKVIIDN